MHMSKIDALIYLTASAPVPTANELSMYQKLDKFKNPYNDPHRPKLRDTIEIIADHKLEMAKLLYKKIMES